MDLNFQMTIVPIWQDPRTTTGTPHFDASPDWTADEDETKPKTASDDADDDGPLGQDDIDNLFD